MNVALLFDVHGWLLAAALGFARIGPIFFMLPFLDNNVLTGSARNAVIVIVALGFWPPPLNTVIELGTLPYLAAVAQELTIGAVLGALLAWPFWVFHAAGSLIDNQRGATFSSSVDPANGIDTSELANFLNLFVGAVYLHNGGLDVFVRAIDGSYRLCDPLQGCALEWTAATQIIDAVIVKAVVVASPVIALLFLCEMSLGLLGRFTPQMNPFSVSMTVKSVVVFGMLLIYMSPLFSGEIIALSPTLDDIRAFLKTG
ncbi:SpaR/YscT/HrcT type III secretion system export apparatus protein [Burkholderia dolosa]|uniref:SpaR/YscT/HrcT type III secretion system export apparatus protein n=1 Tax=Burkholderia dolosa TaxID=152500 RepID=A0A892IIN5_9BURK|nr:MULTISPECIES: type III secretion system export apparatus subunit SctT [Burkholderia]AKE05327.1 type III secretion system protein SpaR [Burkholderia cepacia]AJY09858.1 type III secretion apparatus protein SpaR/YscT/HrcT [Burkholderia dolosa AU0158]AYZ94358.1 SpaR/YscT/HrcT type III secretion system export apparatus protein [Burkholderia dolosa]EAY71547.1 Type III secretory pathway component EscT [Burkholderia dolosa AU0158]ETP63600.1 type III secretion system protein SpaR [Burkholderia dolos